MNSWTNQTPKCFKHSAKKALESRVFLCLRPLLNLHGYHTQYSLPVFILQPFFSRKTMNGTQLIEKKKGCRYLSWGLELELWILIAVLEHNRRHRSSSTVTLYIFLANSRWFCQYFEFCSEVSNVPWQLWRMLVPFWTVCVSKIKCILFNFWIVTIYVGCWI